MRLETSLHKAIILIGSHRIGKTTLLHSLQSRLVKGGKEIRYLNCDLEEERQAVKTTSCTILDRTAVGKDVLLIDEVQHMDQPGKYLDLIWPDRLS